MRELIGGKEALIALANGRDVLCIGKTYESKPDDSWIDAKEMEVGIFLNDAWSFKLKPRTISINGIEVPACGVDYKPHTFMFVLNSLEPCEYSKIILDESDEIPPYWWSTEEEIRQVVVALREVFK